VASRQWRLPLRLGREQNLQNRTAVSAVLLPPLRETARCTLAFFSSIFVDIHLF
jgi:hypothetical protein